MRPTILARFLLPYVAFLICLSGGTSLSYRLILRNLEDEFGDRHRMGLSHAIETIERSFGEVHDMAFALSHHAGIARFQTVDDYLTPGNLSLLISLQRSLPPYQITNTIVHDYLVHFRRSDVIVSPDMAAIRLPLYYGGSIRYGTADYTEWYEDWFLARHDRSLLPPADVLHSGKSISLIGYLQSFPIDYGYAPAGTFVFLIDPSAISRQLHHLIAAERGWMLVFDAETRPILSLGVPLHEDTIPDILGERDGRGASAAIDGVEYRLFRAESSALKWTFVSGLPRDALLQELRPLRQLTVIVTLTALLLGTTAALLLAYRTSTPIRAISRLLKSTDEDDRDPQDHAEQESLDGLAHAVSNVVVRSRQLESDRLRHLPLVRAALFERLLRGELTDTADWQLSRSDPKPMAQPLGYRCLLIHVVGHVGLPTTDKLTYCNGARAAVREVVAECLGASTYVHDLAVEDVVVLYEINDAGDATADIQRRANKLSKILQQEFSVRVLLSCGSRVDDLSNVFLSLNQARQAIARSPGAPTTAVLWYVDSTESACYTYPLETELVLTNSIRSANVEKATEIIAMVETDNLSRQTLSPDMMRELFHELRGTMSKSLDQLVALRGGTSDNMTTKLASLDPTDKPEDFFHSLRALTAGICRLYEAQKRSHNQSLCDRMMDLIGSNIENQDLGLSWLAARLGLSETYLSQFFKEQTGERFVAYVTGLRVRKARQLLLDKNSVTHPVKAIAASVGYSCTETFRKAFKRYYGVSPTEVRDDPELHGSRSSGLHQM